ncbi:outer membrane protein assembly factor BamB family protein [Microbacterium sp. GXF7504]
MHRRRGESPRRRAGAYAGVIGVVLAGTVVLVAASDASVRPDTAGAWRYLPEDGLSRWVEGDAGTSVQEHQRSNGIAPLFTFPEDAQSFAFAAYDEDDVSAVRHWVVSSIRPDGGQQRDLHRIDASGVRLVVSTGAPNAVVFIPGMLVLAADVAPGATWTSAGAAVFASPGEDGPLGAELAYAAEFAARTPEDPVLVEHADDPGCLEVVGRTELAWGEGIEPDRFEEIALWCPGAGQVAVRSSVNDADPSLTVPADAPEGAPVLSDPPRSWDVGGWDAAAVPAVREDPVFGAWPVVPNPLLPPVPVGDGWAVAEDVSGDVTLFVPDGDGALAGRTVLHPGGDVTALGTAHGVLVAATTARTVVGYDRDGRRLWSVTLPDLVMAAPVAAGDDAVVLAGLDGTVRALDAVTGEERWRTRISADGVGAVEVAGDLVVAADRVGRVAALGAADGRIRWSADGDRVTALAAVGPDVYVARGAVVERVRAADGDHVWDAETGAAVSALAVAGGIVALSGLEAVVGLDAAGGGERWKLPPAVEVLTDGATIALVRDGTLTVVDDTGRTVGEWAVPPSTVTWNRSTVAGPDAVWWFDAGAGVGRIGP